MNAPKKPPMVTTVDLSEGDRRRVERIGRELSERMAARFDTDPTAMARYIGRLEVHLRETLRILHGPESFR